MASAAIDSTNMRVASGPYLQRTGLSALITAVCFGWLFVAIWTGVCVYTFAHNSYWSIVLAGSTVLFATFLTYLTHNLIADAYKAYVFELTESEAVLSVTDRWHHTIKTTMILLDDIKFAEYYPYKDSESIIFHSPQYDMEVPLWSLGRHAQDVLDYLTGRGVRIINVQSDDAFPD